MFPDWFDNKTVAVVGNARSQFEKQTGPEIDSHDIVVRMNLAPGLHGGPTKYKDTHGIKTDVWAMYDTHEWRRHQISFTGKIIHIGDDHWNNTTADYVLPRPIYGEAAKLIKHLKISTGFGVLYLLTKCNPKHVNIYGFDWKKTPSFPQVNVITTYPHNFPAEQEWIQTNLLTRPNYTLK